MRILVYPHLMEIGGSQLNAIEIASRVQRLGHEIVLFGPRGALVPVAEKLGLQHIPSPREGSWPSPRNIWALRDLIKTRNVDVTHGYEWGPAMELALSGSSLTTTASVTTILSMSVPDFLPKRSTLVVGTVKLAHQQSGRRARVRLMEPPIDTTKNAPRDTKAARARFGFSAEEVVLAIVCRLTTDLDKLQGTLTAIKTVDELSVAHPVRLLVVGGGPGLAGVQEAAREVAGRRGRDVVVVTGEMLDPADAYDAADIVLGMGSSALKGMAFSKPLVVQGERGYWRLLDESTLSDFLEQGWFGCGGGYQEDLEPILRDLVADRVKRGRLGAFGRRVVTERYDLDRAAEQMLQIYEEELHLRLSPTVASRDLYRSVFELTKFKVFRFGESRMRPILREASRTVIPRSRGAWLTTVRRSGVAQ